MAKLKLYRLIPILRWFMPNEKDKKVEEEELDESERISRLVESRFAYLHKKAWEIAKHSSTFEEAVQVYLAEIYIITHGSLMRDFKQQARELRRQEDKRNVP